MSYETACSEAAVSTITGQDVFVNLANLRYLAIDLVLGDFNPASLRHLREVTLDMSYWQLTPDVMKNLMQHIHLYRPPLTTLNMTAAQRVDIHQTTEPIRMKDGIYQYVENLPLKHLELLDKGSIEVQPGLKEYLPQLEVFRVGGNELLTLYQGDYQPLLLECALLDLLMHPNIREYNFFFSDPNRSSRIHRRDLTYHCHVTCRLL